MYNFELKITFETSHVHQEGMRVTVFELIVKGARVARAPISNLTVLFRDY